ncbi:sugar transporter [Culex quinquefasciatus]|uniref:Sugar transporter n=1 Tax=Culex quinquefasciatus TaxID=7176 RepID=B0WZW9_CULQU|nr:sugar transporter [Culex quinquefasciatus]|eukprot:XP_001862941.1 sugar transporter [Culex quinquefasciatus]
MHRSKATFREFLVAAVGEIIPLTNISAICVGLTVGWPSPMFQKLTDQGLSDNPIGYPIVESEQSWINSVLAVGGFFGPFAAGFLADWKGRKLALWLSGVIHIVGWIMLLQSTSVPVMIAARFVQGFAGGCILNGLTMYIGEIASDEYRGILGSFLQIGQTIGTLYVYLIGPYVSYISFQWICCAVPLLFTILFFYMPETPHFFISKGLYQQAANSLMYLRDASLEEIQGDLQLTKDYVLQEESVQKSNAFRSLFTNRANLRALMISFCLISLQQWSGIDCIQSNSELIFEKAEIALPSEVCTIIMGAVQVVFSISWIPLTGMIGFISIYNVGFGPVPWAIAAEIFAHDVKALGSMIIVSSSWVLDFLALRFFLLISESYGFEWAFWIFGLVCAGAFLFTLLCVIETKGLSLQEIQNRLGGGGKKVEEE